MLHFLTSENEKSCSDGEGCLERGEREVWDTEKKTRLSVFAVSNGIRGNRGPRLNSAVGNGFWLISLA